MKSIVIIYLTSLFAGHCMAQCTKDIECKGDRICVKGKCVDQPQIQPKPCTKDVDCLGDSTCDKGKCIPAGVKSPVLNSSSDIVPMNSPMLQPTTQAPQEIPQNYTGKDCDSSKEAGARQAQFLHKTTGWEWGGAASGLFAGFIGIGVVTGIAACTSPSPQQIPEDVIKECYTKGYGKKARSNNIKAAFNSSFGGTMAAIVLVVTIWATSM